MPLKQLAISMEEQESIHGLSDSLTIGDLQWWPKCNFEIFG